MSVSKILTNDLHIRSFHFYEYAHNSQVIRGFTSGTYPTLLRELVAEFTLTDNPANTSSSLLRSMCHVDDSVILGSWLQETDHKAIEDQVSKYGV